jgi:hypothetical protein
MNAPNVVGHHISGTQLIEVVPVAPPTGPIALVHGVGPRTAPRAAAEGEGWPDELSCPATSLCRSVPAREASVLVYDPTLGSMLSFLFRLWAIRKLWQIVTGSGRRNQRRSATGSTRRT